VTAGSTASGKLLAISDLHIGYRENREIVENLRPPSSADWLLVAGDVADKVADVAWALGRLRERFAAVVWVPGNHELWTVPGDPVQLRGVARYEYLVEVCRRLDVVTPEDPYPVWTGPGGPLTVVPLFLLYDYTFRPAGTSTKAEALERAYQTGVVANDERLLYPDPYPSLDEWCRARLALTGSRLAGLDPGLPTVLVNHFPLTREPTQILRYPEFALWCGTERTADWHLRYRAATVVYGHLHIPRTIHRDGVVFEEVSLGYPREWQRRPVPPGRLRQIMPRPSVAAAAR
jgi:3',5'-cyclic AMP phosphodiesterase CpdA